MESRAYFLRNEKTKILWKKIKRNGNFSKKKREILKSVQSVSDNGLVAWMHSYAQKQIVENTPIDNERIPSVDTERSESMQNIEVEVHHHQTIPKNVQNELGSGIYGLTSSDQSEESIYDSQSCGEASDEGEISGGYTETKILRNELRNWAIQHQLTHIATNSLLSTLRTQFPREDLPIDARTLLQTPRSSLVQNHDENKSTYWHYGVKKAIMNALSDKNLSDRCYQLNINIDGIPMFKSSLSSFWPILIQIHELRSKISPLITGIFCGKSKYFIQLYFLNHII